MKDDGLPLQAVHSVPQEIVDLIIEQVGSDKEALSTFALVSQSWLPSARRRLFADVSLYQDWDCDDVGILYSVPHRRVDAGLEIVGTTPVIASAIRSVCYNGTNQDFLSTIVKVFQFISHFPNLRSLHIKNVSWPDFQKENLPAVLKDLTTTVLKVEDLFLGCVIFANGADFSAFVHAFRNLRRLSLYSVQWTDLSNSSVFRPVAGLPHTQAPRLERLIVEGHESFQQLMEMLLKVDSFDLELDAMLLLWDETCEVPNDFSMHGKFFDVIGLTLRFLVLRIDIADDHDLSVITWLLAKCQFLQSISIDASLSWRPTKTPCVWFWPICEALAAGSSSHLEKLTIASKLSTDAAFNQYVPWALLDSVLSDTHRFPNFHKLHVIVRRPYYYGMSKDLDCTKEDADTALKGLMPRLSATGVLGIEHGDYSTCGPEVMPLRL